VYGRARTTAFRWAAATAREPRCVQSAPHSPRGSRSPPCWPSAPLRHVQLLIAQQWWLHQRTASRRSQHSAPMAFDRNQPEKDNLRLVRLGVSRGQRADRLAQGMTIPLRLIDCRTCAPLGRTARVCGPWPCVPADQAVSMDVLARRAGGSGSQQFRSPAAASMPPKRKATASELPPAKAPGCGGAASGLESGCGENQFRLQRRAGDWDYGRSYIPAQRAMSLVGLKVPRAPGWRFVADQ